jgi:uncharacterized membrane protein
MVYLLYKIKKGVIMKMTEERRKELREFNEQVKIARKKRQEEQLAKWREEMDKRDERIKANKKSTTRKVTPKTYNYRYDTDPLGYQTGDMPREMWFRDRD